MVEIVVADNIGQEGLDNTAQNNINNEDLGAPPVKRRTHFSEEHSAFLKTLPLVIKLQTNKLIDERNSARKIKALENRINRVIEPESDCESAITLEDEEVTVLLDDENRKLYLPHMGLKTIEWLTSQKKRDTTSDANAKKRGSDAPADKQHEFAKRCYILGDDITPYVLGEVSKIVFPAIMSHTYDAVDIPLPVFTTENLLWLNANLGAALPVRRANANQGEKKGFQIIDVDKLCEDRNCKELSLSCSEWDDAARNMFDFHCQLDAYGINGKHARWFAKHFSFFHNLRARESKYEAWKVIDLEIRQSFRAEKKEFDLGYYQAKLDQEILRLKTEAGYRTEIAGYRSEIAALLRSVNTHVQGPNKAGFVRNGGNSRPPSSSQSFLGSKRSQTCLLCGGKDHNIHAHDGSDSSAPSAFPDGSPFACKVENRRLLIKSGKLEGKEVCVSFNVKGDRASCTHRETDRTHACSFCGKPGHFAFAWTCRPRPSNI